MPTTTTTRDRAPARDFVAQLAERLGRPYTVDIDRPRDGALRNVVRLCDHGDEVVYRLGTRSHSGLCAFGFTEHAADPSGRMLATAVSAAEVVAVAREVDREGEVYELVEAALPYAHPRERRRLEHELRAARELERVALPRIQAAILRCLESGLTLTDLSERGGFTSTAPARSAKTDTSWLQRRAGLTANVCRTGKRRRARTASYDVFLMLVKAVDGDPFEFGV